MHVKFYKKITLIYIAKYIFNNDDFFLNNWVSFPQKIKINNWVSNDSICFEKRLYILLAVYNLLQTLIKSINIKNQKKKKKEEKKQGVTFKEKKKYIETN